MTSQRTRERLVQRLREKGIGDERVLEVMRQLPRHLFVDEALASRAYEEKSLPIGHGQTLSQPYTVARMTEILLQQAPRRVLEVGTGSGYQTAVLAGLVDEVFSIERLSVLSERARTRLRELGCRNVRLRTGDGSTGWDDHAPFDGILVTAAPEEVPEQLLYQLVDGGRLVIPVGGAAGQRLLAITRQGDRFVQDSFDAVTFVPLLTGSEPR